MPPKIKNNNKLNNLKKYNSKKKLNDSDIEDLDELNEDENEDDDEDDDKEKIDDEIIDDEINDDEININDHNDDDEDNESYSDSSENNEKNNDIDADNDDQNDNYIDNEETLSKKCYKKYLLMEDEVNLEEIFGDEDIHIIKNDRLTKPILTKYEKVRLLSVRIKQLAQGAKPLIKDYSGLSSKEIALEELKNKIIPLIIERPIPNVGIEKWKLSELEILF